MGTIGGIGVIHYHGTPITPAIAAAQILIKRHAFVSFAHPEQMDVVQEVCQSFALDNGAFSAWRSGEPVSDWSGYYEWVNGLRKHPAFDFAVIPDKIDGNENDNRALIREWPHGDFIGAPVWHLHESLNFLAELIERFPRICLGSSGEFATVGNLKWWRRINDAMKVCCDDLGRPKTKIHGLRMLWPQAFTQIPLSSADSTNVARNIGIDSAWTGSYLPPTKAWRGMTIAERIEMHNSPATWSGIPKEFSVGDGGTPRQCGLFEGMEVENI